jgi:hypothetical protein
MRRCDPALHLLPAFTRRLRVTPAMEAGLADRVRSIEDVIGLLDAAEKNAA